MAELAELSELNFCLGNDCLIHLTQPNHLKPHPCHFGVVDGVIIDQCPDKNLTQTTQTTQQLDPVILAQLGARNNMNYTHFV